MNSQLMLEVRMLCQITQKKVLKFPCRVIIVVPRVVRVCFKLDFICCIKSRPITMKMCLKIALQSKICILMEISRSNTKIRKRGYLKIFKK